MYPFHSESERDYQAWIGRYVSCWAGTETMMENLVDILYRHFGAEDIEERPLSLNRRLRFFRKAFAKIDALSHEKEEMTALVGFFSSESAFRHDLVHGINVNFGEFDPYYAVMQRPVDRNDPLGPTKQITVTQEDLAERYDKIGYAGLCVGGISHRLLLKMLETQ